MQGRIGAVGRLARRDGYATGATLAPAELLRAQPLGEYGAALAQLGDHRFFLALPGGVGDVDPAGSDRLPLARGRRWPDLDVDAEDRKAIS